MTIVLEKRREELLAMRSRITGAVIHLHEGEDGIDEHRPARGGQHPAEKAAALLEKEIDESVEGSVEHVVREIDDALARIDAGTYGVCAVCGKPIPEERLDAVPYAVLCIEDKRAEEHH
jgi:RNA polymerase-binding transcription factor DksA